MKHQVNNCSLSIKLKFPLIMRVVYRSFNCSLLFLEEVRELFGSSGSIKRWKKIKAKQRKNIKVN